MGDFMLWKLLIKEKVGIKTQAELDAKIKAAANNKRLRDFKEAVKNKTVNAEVQNQPKPQLSEKQEQTQETQAKKQQ